MTIYNPDRFSVKDLDSSFELMNQHPFATVISVSSHGPVVSHLPLTPKRDGDNILLVGHLARANPHAKVLMEASRDSEAKVTAIFHGPHAYITPKWYVENDVPTWNYAVVHAVGRVEVIEDAEGILSCLRELATHSETLWPSGWKFFVPEDLQEPTLTRSIIGFKIRVEKLEHKNKMGQNRSPDDLVGVVNGLALRGDDNSLGVRDAILKSGSDLKK